MRPRRYGTEFSAGEGRWIVRPSEWSYGWFRSERFWLSGFRSTVPHDLGDSSFRANGGHVRFSVFWERTFRPDQDEKHLTSGTPGATVPNGERNRSLLFDFTRPRARLMTKHGLLPRAEREFAHHVFLPTSNFFTNSYSTGLTWSWMSVMIDCMHGVMKSVQGRGSRIAWSLRRLIREGRGRITVSFGKALDVRE